MEISNRIIIIVVAFMAIVFFFASQYSGNTTNYEISVNWESGEVEQVSASTPTEVEITVYSVPGRRTFRSYTQTPLIFDYDYGLALVKEKRTANLPEGPTILKYPNIAKYINPASVKLTDLSFADTYVIEQNYHYDLVSQSKIAEKYINKEVSVEMETGNVSGILLSYGGGLVLQTDSGIEAISSGIQKIKYPELPEGLITTPTMEWKLSSAGSGNHEIEMSYLTSGMSWKADYVAIANSDDTQIDLQGWVTVDNKAGATYENAKLKLIAGDIHLVSEAAPMYDYAYAEAMGAPRAQQFAEESLFEYHMYTLQRPTTLRDNEMKQISLLESDSVSVQKEYVYDPDRSEKVQVKLNFDNAEENGLGIPLPKGTVRVYKKDSEGQLQFIGEDSIDHTPKDEQIRLFLGNAFDITAEKETTNYEDLGRCASQYSYEVEIRNHKDEGIVVTVLDREWGEWEMISENFVHTKESQYLISWKIPVSADSSTVLSYMIRHRWC